MKSFWGSMFDTPTIESSVRLKKNIANPYLRQKPFIWGLPNNSVLAGSHEPVKVKPMDDWRASQASSLNPTPPNSHSDWSRWDHNMLVGPRSQHLQFQEGDRGATKELLTLPAPPCIIQGPVTASALIQMSLLLYEMQGSLEWFKRPYPALWFRYQFYLRARQESDSAGHGSNMSIH